MHPRYSERKPTTAKVTLSAGPRVGEGQVLDLTVPGCLLQTAMPLERGQDVQLLIYLNELRPMRINLGIVRWVSGRTAGIEFVRMSAEDQERLRIVIGYKPQLRLSVSWGETPLCVAY
ncbi:MAG: PilZ domain-containing protein [Nitrospira sp.]|nr:MAG: PilZ domain-containing protein [Nitrospira sp.]